MWHDEVDVVCVGSGVAALATAIAAVDSGAKVLVARPGGCHGRGGAAGRRPWLGPGTGDPETDRYFMELSDDLAALSRGAWVADLPLRVLDDLPVEDSARVAPFYGAQLREWATRCLSSPYGLLYSRPPSGDAETAWTRTGEALHVTAVGTIRPDGGVVTPSALTGCLFGQSLERRIPVTEASSLQRIVFEEGEVVGAVIATPEGSLAVRARHGVAVAPDPATTASALPAVGLADHRELQVCLVRKAASRFGRVELLTSGHTAPMACFEHDRELPRTLSGRSSSQAGCR